VSLRIFGIRDDETRDLVGLATGIDVLIPPQVLDGYPRGQIEDTDDLPAGLPIWVLYDHPTDWPDWYVARLFVNETRTGNMLFCRNIEPLRDEMVRRGLVPMMRAISDDPVIMETWL
jgi:hypothetical protein